MKTTPERVPYFRIRLFADERAYPDLLDVSAFLLDLTTLYEVVRLRAEKPDQELTRWTLYRNRYRVPEPEKLFLQSLRHESPLDLNAVFLAAGAGVPTMWVLVQIFEKIWNLPLNHRKLRAEVEKLERENGRAVGESAASAVLRDLERNDGERVLPRLENRLRSSDVRVVGAEIDVVHLPPPTDPPKKKDEAAAADAHVAPPRRS